MVRCLLDDPTRLGGRDGSLVAWHYPTSLFANLADHTYVLEDRRSRDVLLEHRRSVEERRLELERAFFHHELSVRQFVDAFNELTIELQHRAAETLDGDRVVVGDPAVAEAAYPAR